MPANLGETTDPKELIPGVPDSVKVLLQAIRTRGDALHKAGSGLKRIDTADGWTGKAGDAFREKFQGQPSKWLEAGDCFHDAANALERYCHTLTWAQGQASDAIKQWNEGESATRQAKAQHQRAEQQAGHDLAFHDPGEAKRQAAQHTLNSARTQLSQAGDVAAKTVGTARDKAPEKPGFWSKVGDFFEDAGAGLENAAGTVVNGLASFGNTIVHHPLDAAGMVAGTGLMLLGGAGEVGGGALDITGAGAAVGVPVNIASAGLIGSGGAMTAAGATDLMMHMSGDDSVSPMRTDHEGSGGDEYEADEGFRHSEFSKDEIVEFAHGHAGDGNPAMGRPTKSEIDAALSNAEGKKLDGQNAERFDYKGVRVIVNYDTPWKSTTYYPGR
ncbi:putative T7SS-secreted protein [Streptomyces lydicus]|uniref:putative T7SS-secreted protein n=1 Tax=Streptomyces lydicus TaxID=47763 RepID=UPI00378B5920